MPEDRRQGTSSKKSIVADILIEESDNEVQSTYSALSFQQQIYQTEEKKSRSRSDSKQNLPPRVKPQNRSKSSTLIKINKPTVQTQSSNDLSTSAVAVTKRWNKARKSNIVLKKYPEKDLIEVKEKASEQRHANYANMFNEKTKLQSKLDSL